MVFCLSNYMKFKHLISITITSVYNIQTRSYLKFKIPFNTSKELTKMSEVKLGPKSLTKQKNKASLKNNSRFPPSEIYLCVVGNGSTSSPRSLYMFTDHERYLFNCGEGTQRLSSEHKMKMSKLNHIFITHNSWENTGGLLGLSLTVQDIGVSKLNIHGSPDLATLFESSKSFVYLKELKIYTNSYEKESFNDDCMKVDYIPIFASTTLSCDNAEKPDSDSDSSVDDNDMESSERVSKRQRLSKENNNVTVAFACKGHSKQGHLMFEKCIEQGVPPGPLLGDLKNGKDVTLPSGKIVRSKDVVSPEQVCPLFLVVECPSERFLEAFVAEEKFKKYQKGTGNESDVASLVVHFTPPEVLKSFKYQEWMNRFPASTCHLILNNDCPTLNSAAVHRIQHKLNLLHPGIFGLLHETEAENKSTENNIYLAHTLDKYFLRPSKGFDRSSSLSIEPKEFLAEALNMEGFKTCLSELQSKIHTSNHLANGSYPEVVFLGTGSSVPSKVRNVSGILVNTSENKSMLLDCGEGTYGQLYRMYGKDSRNILSSLFCIFISHMHADHHLGLIKILNEREKIFKSMNVKPEPIKLIGPRNLLSWLNNYYQAFESLSPQYRFVSCSSLEHIQYFESTESFIERNEDIVISTVPVIHCSDAHAVILSSQTSKWKLVYSGDTTPCPRLVSAGKDCSLLIHEATMEDELKEDAIMKRHSTTSEAIQIGEDMNSKYTLLTHFSQRYAKIPIFNESFHKHVGCAFDNMKIQSNELHILPLLIPALKILFAEEVEELHIRGVKRKLRQEMETMLKENSQ